MLMERNRKKRIFCLLFLFVFVCCMDLCGLQVYKIKAQNPSFQKKYKTQSIETISKQKEQVDFSLTAESAVLMEKSTGYVLYQKDAKQRKSPASITKIMTLLLIFDELDAGRIKLQDEVTTSAYAKSMGGSQVFLEEGETQSVETLIKCIAVSSGNDASVAMAEYIAGSEEAFVKKMNEKAAGLGMHDTHFEDCCGLTDSDNHFTSAYDVALMSRALISSHPQIFDYTKIWMENITHTTAKGSKEFTLSSTNKLLKQYPYTTGLKTGSTSKAKFCFSATAQKNGIDLIAVVMACPDGKARFAQARQLLDYGFSVTSCYTDRQREALGKISVIGGKKDEAELMYEDTFTYFDFSQKDISAITKRLELPRSICAPCKKGDQAGRIVYMLEDKEIGFTRILLKEDVKKATYYDQFCKVLIKMLL